MPNFFVMAREAGPEHPSRQANQHRRQKRRHSGAFVLAGKASLLGGHGQVLRGTRQGMDRSAMAGRFQRIALVAGVGLDQPAEQVIAGIRHMPVLRTTLVEIGNLVSGPGASTPLLYLLLLAVLARAGYRWLMFVATPEAQRGIRALGLEIDAVCPADPGRIANVAAWGSYYAVHPQVMLGCVEDGMRHCTADAHLADALIRADASIATLASRLGAP